MHWMHDFFFFFLFSFLRERGWEGKSKVKTLHATWSLGWGRWEFEGLVGGEGCLVGVSGVLCRAGYTDITVL
jgi:hypothetical protein